MTAHHTERTPEELSAMLDLLADDVSEDAAPLHARQFNLRSFAALVESVEGAIAANWRTMTPPEGSTEDFMHQRYSVNAFTDACRQCGEEWPCRQALISENERLRAEVDRMRAALSGSPTQEETR